MKYFKLFLMMFVFFSVYANQISVVSDNEVFQIVNTNNKKIYPYYLLTAGKTLSLQVKDIDSLEILTRKIIEPGNPIEYSYEIICNDSTRQIFKTARLSSVSRGVSGEKISTYNKHIQTIEKNQEKISIKNTSPSSFIIKFDAEKYTREKKAVDFVAFTPEVYDKEVILAIDERTFSYFKPKKSDIMLTLEGPLELKIISRLLFDDSFSMQQNYRYKVFINDIEKVEYIETAIKSQKAKLVLEEETGISTGNVQQLQIEKGIQKIRIEAPHQNRDVIFRFFINKTAIGN